MKDMMRSLLTVRKQVQSLFAEWNVYLVMAAKTALAFAVILSINAVFPYRAVLTRGLIVAAVAILCSVLPWGFITVFGLIFLLGQLTALSLEAALFVLVLALGIDVTSIADLSLQRCLDFTVKVGFLECVLQHIEFQLVH